MFFLNLLLHPPGRFIDLTQTTLLVQVRPDSWFDRDNPVAKALVQATRGRVVPAYVESHFNETAPPQVRFRGRQKKAAYTFSAKFRTDPKAINVSPFLAVCQARLYPVELDRKSVV